MPAAGALVLQAVGLASLREAERAAASLRAVQPDLEYICVGDAETLRWATATFQRKIDVEEGLDATIRAALRRAGHGTRDRVPAHSLEAGMPGPDYARVSRFWWARDRQ